MIKIKIASLFFLVFLLSTCTKDMYAPDVCFTENVLPIFVSNCTYSGCHNATQKKEGYDFTNYEGIMRGINAKHPLLSDVYLSIRGNNPSMPTQQYGALSEKDVNTIKIWIKMGAPNSSNCNDCDTVNYTYSGRIAPTLQTWCVGCHNSSNTGGSIDLSSYAGVASSVASGSFMGSINHVSPYSPMPQNGNKLSQCEIDAIQKWVNNGYPNN